MPEDSNYKRCLDEIEHWNEKISEIKDNVDSNREQINANLDGINYCRKFMFNLEEVLQEHLKGHLRVYELIDSVDKPVDIMWKKHLEEQLEKLDQKDGEKSDAPVDSKGFYSSAESNSKPSKDRYDELFGKDANYWRSADKILKEKEPTEGFPALYTKDSNTVSITYDIDMFKLVLTAGLEWLFDKIATLDRNGIHYVKYHQLREKYLGKKEDEEK